MGDKPGRVFPYGTNLSLDDIETLGFNGDGEPAHIRVKIAGSDGPHTYEGWFPLGINYPGEDANRRFTRDGEPFKLVDPVSGEYVLGDETSVRAFRIFTDHIWSEDALFKRGPLFGYVDPHLRWSGDSDQDAIDRIEKNVVYCKTECCTVKAMRNTSAAAWMKDMFSESQIPYQLKVALPGTEDAALIFRDSELPDSADVEGGAESDHYPLAWSGSALLWQKSSGVIHLSARYSSIFPMEFNARMTLDPEHSKVRLVDLEDAPAEAKAVWEGDYGEALISQSRGYFAVLAFANSPIYIPIPTSDGVISLTIDDDGSSIMLSLYAYYDLLVEKYYQQWEDWRMGPFMDGYPVDELKITAAIEQLHRQLEEQVFLDVAKERDMEALK